MVVIKLKKSILTVVVLVTAAVGILSAYLTVNALSPRPQTVIVVDAGHGGADGGVTGKVSGVTEAEINLAIAKLVKKRLERAGYEVVMTRKTADGLYKNLKGDFKAEDFAERKRIIRDADATLVISIHQNFYTSPVRRGAQVFFNPDNEGSIAFAKCMQSALNEGVNDVEGGRSFSALKGDYYITKCSDAPAIIIECGFLSNPQDEKLLLTDDFREDFSYHVLCGVTAYLVSVGSVSCP